MSSVGSYLHFEGHEGDMCQGFQGRTRAPGVQGTRSRTPGLGSLPLTVHCSLFTVLIQWRVHCALCIVQHCNRQPTQTPTSTLPPSTPCGISSYLSVVRGLEIDTQLVSSSQGHNSDSHHQKRTEKDMYHGRHMQTLITCFRQALSESSPARQNSS